MEASHPLEQPSVQVDAFAASLVALASSLVAHQHIVTLEVAAAAAVAYLVAVLQAPNSSGTSDWITINAEIDHL